MLHGIIARQLSVLTCFAQTPSWVTIKTYITTQSENAPIKTLYFSNILGNIRTLEPQTLFRQHTTGSKENCLPKKQQSWFGVSDFGWMLTRPKCYLLRDHCQTPAHTQSYSLTNTTIVCNYDVVFMNKSPQGL